MSPYLQRCLVGEVLQCDRNPHNTADPIGAAISFTAKTDCSLFLRRGYNRLHW